MSGCVAFQSLTSACCCGICQSNNPVPTPTKIRTVVAAFTDGRPKVIRIAIRLTTKITRRDLFIGFINIKHPLSLANRSYLICLGLVCVPQKFIQPLILGTVLLKESQKSEGKWTKCYFSQFLFVGPQDSHVISPSI